MRGWGGTAWAWAPEDACTGLQTCRGRGTDGVSSGTFDVDIVPAQAQDLIDSAACQQQQPQRRPGHDGGRGSFEHRRPARSKVYLPLIAAWPVLGRAGAAVEP